MVKIAVARSNLGTKVGAGRGVGARCCSPDGVDHGISALGIASGSQETTVSNQVIERWEVRRVGDVTTHDQAVEMVADGHRSEMIEGSWVKSWARQEAARSSRSFKGDDSLVMVNQTCNK